ncbi:hypothetical protein BGZ92_011863 [Podila epicladia]|nr:hypothetical protein BGZ92_011863 [Podila epicladia]
MAWNTIPELVEALAPLLLRGDISRCSQVSCLWYKVFNPYLWHSIDDQEEPWRSILKNEARDELLRLAQQPHIIQHKNLHNRSWIDTVLTRNHRHIRNLTFSYPHPALIQSFIQSTNKEKGTEHSNNMEVIDKNTIVPMSVLDIGVDLAADSNKWYRHRAEMTRCCWQLLVDHADTLEHVDFRNSHASDIMPLRYRSFMYKLFQSFGSLRTLAIMPDDNIFKFLHFTLPSLETLTIHPRLWAEHAFYFLLQA